MSFLRCSLVLLILVAADLQGTDAKRRVHKSNNRRFSAGRYEDVKGEGRFSLKLAALKAALTSTTPTTTTTTTTTTTKAPATRFIPVRSSIADYFDLEDGDDLDFRARPSHLRFRQQQEQLLRLQQQQQEQQLKLEKHEEQLRLREQAVDQAINFVRLELKRERIRRQQSLRNRQSLNIPNFWTQTSELAQL